LGNDLFFNEQVTQPLRHISPVVAPGFVQGAGQREAADNWGLSEDTFALTQIVNPMGIPQK
jgi:hypothetical protein